ncbi:deoxyribose-phosphate aldolase [Hutsoniella sourekii]|uniref:deoxyribose-phosphate aldolase n=1 Tax=Hutsoniella sourekii TaxID=87650 RepID=UPI0004AD0025|nr:deoxyribose-phosphate aldolase [Hutsoniella sourekii]
MNKVKRFQPGTKISVKEFANTLDHSLLNPSITVKELKEGCQFAKDNHCISVCVRPSDLPIVLEELEGSDVLPTTVIGFPHGTCTTETKLFETKDAIEKGAVEIDMVINIARFLSGEYDYVKNEIAEICKIAHQHDVIVKVIFENHYLNDEQIIKACELSTEAGADFVKTSTGYAPSGSKIHDLKLMRSHIADNMEVKAAGGVRTIEDALKVLGTGTVRIGTSGSAKLLEKAKELEAKGELVVL